jgi:hypothetical protein
MQILKISEEEARQMLEDDKAIDKGEKLFELSEEQKKNAKKARQADRSPTVYTFTKRERKADEDKRFLIKELTKAVSEWNPEVTNQEREIEFIFNNRKFKITLSAPRK